MKHNYGKILVPSLITFVTITVIFMAAPRFWDNLGVSHRVVVVGNLLLYPNMFTNSVMGSTVLKLFVLGIATVIYLVIVGKERSVFGIVATMVLYIIYTVLDVKAALILNKKQ